MNSLMQGNRGLDVSPEGRPHYQQNPLRNQVVSCIYTIIQILK
jgi:hypothetical protein